MSIRYLFGLIVIVLVFFGLYYFSNLNKPTQNQETNIRNVEVGLNEKRNNQPTYENISGIVTDIDGSSIIVTDPSGKNYSTVFTSTSNVVKIPNPDLIAQNPNIKKEIPSSLDQVKKGDSISITLSPYSYDIDTLYIYSNSLNDF